LVAFPRRRGLSALRANALKPIGAQLAKISHPRQGLRRLEQKTADIKILAAIASNNERGHAKVKLKCKRVLVLGGTSGIGLAVAQAAKAEGSDVVVVSRQQSRVDAALTLLGEGAEGYVANLSDETAVEALFGKMGPFDHLVYTSGDSVWQGVLGETKLEDAKSFFDVRF
jgi:NADPH:quinone reductase-like Zn-dependent oxidoreductase